MKIYNLCDGTPPVRERVCALGFFDGVHLGHRRIIERCVGEAKARGTVPTVYTFFGEDGDFKSGAPRIYSTEQRLEIFASLGIEEVFVARFSEVADLGSEDFVRDMLFKRLGVRYCTLGFNFRFGRGASGDAEELLSLMRQLGGDAHIEPELKFEGRTLSSTEIRAALAEGNMERAEKMLGAPYSLTGKISHGLGLGRELGFPTLNTPLPQDSPIKSGVYRTRVELDGKVYDALTNVGSCPTVSLRERHIETHLIDFFGEVYGESCKIYFAEFLREEIRFACRDELIAQISRDLKKIKGE